LELSRNTFAISGNSEKFAQLIQISALENQFSTQNLTHLNGAFCVDGLPYRQPGCVRSDGPLPEQNFNVTAVFHQFRLEQNFNVTAKVLKRRKAL
jgi:hypothetical protein